MYSNENHKEMKSTKTQWNKMGTIRNVHFNSLNDLMTALSELH